MIVFQTCLYSINKVLKYLQMTVDGHLQKKMILTLGAGGIDFTGSFSAAFFKGVSVAQRSAMQACLFVRSWVFLIRDPS